jgi:hypothetical protein
MAEEQEAAPASTKGNGGNTNKESATTEEKEPIEYNPRWDGYSVILLSSLLNFAAISSVPSEERQEYWIMSMAFGIATFFLPLFILLQDRFQLFVNQFHYSKARDGYLEGYVLGAFVIWWSVGVGYITRPGGIAYVASNIYYSSWVSLISCVYTLNEWSTEKDILSIAEITGISATLKSWYLHFLSAFVVFSSCIQLHISFHDYDDAGDTSYGISVGFVSLLVSLFFIFVHYDFFTRCELKEGGWMELIASAILVIIWIIGVSLLTSDGGVAATMEGNQCYRDPTSVEGDNCTIVLYLTDTSGANSRVELACERLPRQVRFQ